MLEKQESLKLVMEGSISPASPSTHLGAPSSNPSQQGEGKGRGRGKAERGM